MANLRDILAGNLKKNRKKCGISQSKLAEKAGISTQYIGMIETKVKFPSSDMLQKLAIALKIDPAALFYNEIELETIKKGIQKDILRNFRETFCTIINNYVDEKIKDLDK